MKMPLPALQPLFIMPFRACQWTSIIIVIPGEDPVHLTPSVPLQRRTQSLVTTGCPFASRFLAADHALGFPWAPPVAFLFIVTGHLPSMGQCPLWVSSGRSGYLPLLHPWYALAGESLPQTAVLLLWDKLGGNAQGTRLCGFCCS